MKSLSYLRRLAVYAAGLSAVVEALRAAALAVDLAPLRPTVLTGNLAGAAADFLAVAVLAGALLADVDLAAVVLAGAALTGPRVDVLRVAGLAASLRV